MTTITLLSATDRPGSMALKIARYLKPLYEKEGVDAQIVTLEDFPLTEVAGGKYGQSIPPVEDFRNKVIDADGVLLIIPEYNGSFPGILKLFLDYLPFPEALNKKPLAFIGEAAGAFGALRAVEQFQAICAYRNAHIFPERVFFQRVNSLFDENKGITDPLLSELLEAQIKGFTSFVKGVKSL